ncbi:hypothetical protein B5C34_08735 [Pacificimonas flava]|uniref:Glycosyltransferase subfamily 4-like N-terminal domain-containing protein n=2 Tax=Pacificimonas TaxID=1960290 RepID=A0A219B5B6_9SPHN|nr:MULTISPECIES: glycosyltransferase [Pacificimonas]MBZ6379249.1 glycosyltransferase [Pacificimonas aurantium]OWV33537.1 hypothetical protein B5C34_08735 [Pacificimonas flava]
MTTPRPTQKTFWLLVTHFPPNPSTAGLRAGSFARHAAENSWTGTILTVRQAGDPEGDDGDPAGIRVMRTPAPFSLHWRIDSLLDGGIADMRAMLTGARQAQTAPDVVIATGPPFNTFVAAQHLAKTHGVPLVLDYRDEWTLNPFDFVKRKPFDELLERRALRAASRVLFTTAGMRDAALLRFADEIGEKARILPNGWDPADFSHDNMQGRPPRLATSRKRLLFLGTLSEMLDPRPFLGALAHARRDDPELERRIVVRFTGRKTPEMEAALDAFPYPEMIERVGQVPRSGLEAQLTDSDAAILFTDERVGRYRPTKLYDYLRAGLPIVVWGHGGESGAIVEDTGTGIVTTSIDAVEKLVAAPTQVREKPRAAFLSAHRRDVLAARFFSLLDEVVAEHRFR